MTSCNLPDTSQPNRKQTKSWSPGWQPDPAMSAGQTHIPRADPGMDPVQRQHSAGTMLLKPGGTGASAATKPSLKDKMLGARGGAVYPTPLQDTVATAGICMGRGRLDMCRSARPRVGPGAAHGSRLGKGQQRRRWSKLATLDQAARSNPSATGPGPTRSTGLFVGTAARFIIRQRRLPLLEAPQVTPCYNGMG